VGKARESGPRGCSRTRYSCERQNGRKDRAGNGLSSGTARIESTRCPFHVKRQIDRAYLYPGADITKDDPRSEVKRVIKRRTLLYSSIMLLWPIVAVTRIEF